MPTPGMSRGRVSFEERSEPAAPGASNTPEDYFSLDGSSFEGTNSERDGGSTVSPHHAWRRASLSIQIPPTAARADMAFTALQYLPMPVLVLSSAKTVVMANEAMGRLFGIDPDLDLEGGDEMDVDETMPDAEPSDGDGQQAGQTPTDILYGATLGALGIDLLQNGNAVFVAWDNLLDTVVTDASRSQSESTPLNAYHVKPTEKGTGSPHKDNTPTGSKRSRAMSEGNSASPAPRRHSAKTQVHDSIVDVIFSTHRDPKTGMPCPSSTSAPGHLQTQIIISVWATEHEQYFTLTFTAASVESASQPSSAEGSVIKSSTRTVSRTSTAISVGSLPSGVSSNSSSDSHSRSAKRRSMINSPMASSYASPGTKATQEFPPRGPPAKASATAAPSIFTKSSRLKEALMNSMSIPAYAMWKDESFGIPNRAAIRLIHPYLEDNANFDTDEHARDFLARFVLYREDFSEEIPINDFPIIRLMKERKSFDSYRVGMYSAKDGSQMLFDATGEPLRDEKGDFIGGLVMFHDVTTFATTITRQQKQNERQFEDICNMVPNLVWRADTQGILNYYSDQWYTFTGLTPEESMGIGWTRALHPEDLELAAPKWAHSLATGDEYLAEYRVCTVAGEWRWMLGRAVPTRADDGNITAWFGTCTDIHDLVLAREEAKQTRERLARVLDHAKVSMWAVDPDMNVTLTEGRPMATYNTYTKANYVGRKIWDVFKEQNREGEIKSYKAPIEQILSRRMDSTFVESHVMTTNRWYRTRLSAILKNSGPLGDGPLVFDGVVGISMDTTELKLAEAEVASRAAENAQLTAQSAAAKEASKMKSQFLANMSHEIRTPIAGVIGMSELLLDDETGELTKEQRECAENIQRSANGLLTVINDILDFSKVESGRLDIEEVQFDLSVVIRDVNKMLGFAAERKGLQYIDDVPKLESWKVMGDPGRLRQVMTNLLTNSIKFTTQGSVAMRVEVQKETDGMVEVHFTVEDTGIGIEEDVRKKLFQPFSQADSSTARRFGGTGLGLTISKNLVELMHGEIELESRLGVGTKATFWIPFHKAPYQSQDSPLVDLEPLPERLQAEASVSRPASENSGPPTPTLHKLPHRKNPSESSIPGYGPWPEGSSSETELTPEDRLKTQILVVEDNAVNQQIALKTIKKLGFPVRAVWNGKEAIDYLREPNEERPPPDIILMDVQMPIMDGYKATYTIRNAAPFVNNPDIIGTPIVAMTASAIQGDREKCQQAGMDDYLAKPVKKPHLERMLVKWAIEGRKKRAELHRAAQNGCLTVNQRPRTSRNTSSFTSTSSVSQQSPADLLSSELDRLEYAHRHAAERSTETTNDRVLRQQQAEEQAITLRDHELIEAGEDPKTKIGRGVAEEAHLDDDHTSALTTENMRKLDRTAQLRDMDTKMEEDDSSAVATLADTESNVLSKSQQ